MHVAVRHLGKRGAISVRIRVIVIMICGNVAHKSRNRLVHTVMTVHYPFRHGCKGHDRQQQQQHRSQRDGMAPLQMANGVKSRHGRQLWQIARLWQPPFGRVYVAGSSLPCYVRTTDRTGSFVKADRLADTFHPKRRGHLGRQATR